MVERGLIINKPDCIKNGFHYFAWLTVIQHRYHYPYLFFILIIGVLGSLYMRTIWFFIVMTILIEIFILSISFHETCHMSFARYRKVCISSISIIPCSVASLRTNMSRKNKLSALDLAAITFAGPIIPLFLCVTTIIIMTLLKANLAVYMCIGAFSFINLLSLIPVNRNDGWKIFHYVNQESGILSQLRILSQLFSMIAEYFYRIIGVEKLIILVRNKNKPPKGKY